MSKERVKQEVRERDGYRCTECGMTNDEHRERYGTQLHVHRLEPRSLYTARGCMTVCRKCHSYLPKAAPGTPDPYHSGRNINAWVEEELGEAVDALLARLPLGGSVTAVVKAALKMYLKEEGLWPPPGEEGQP